MLRLYNALLLLLRPAIELWAAWPGRARRSLEWAERRARRLPSVAPRGVWIHGSSVGEVRIVTTLARALRAKRPALPLAVSAYTPTGRAQLPAPPQVDASFFMPLDFPDCARRLLRSLQPAVLALVETEIWPNLLHQALEGGVPVVVLNGRLSVGRMARYRRFSRLYRPLLGRLTRVGAQSATDAARFVELGVPPSAIVVTGNVKYDLPISEIDAGELRRRLGLAEDRPVLVAGSTGPGEEQLVLEAFQRVRLRPGGIVLILAPRHPVRAEEVEQLARSRGLQTARISEPGRPREKLDVLVVDTVGELQDLYGLASVAFVGGSLVPVGGHNVLEPAAAGVPVLFGPHTSNVAGLAASLERSGGGKRVNDPRMLADVVEGLLADPAARQAMASRAASVVRDNRGALAKSVELLLSVLDRPAERRNTGVA